MTKTADIEITEPFVRLGAIGDEGSINLDQDTARALYEMAWGKFETALANLNEIFGAAAPRRYQANRIKRLLWEADSLKQAIEVVYYMTAPSEDDVDD